MGFHKSLIENYIGSELSKQSAKEIAFGIDLSLQQSGTKTGEHGVSIIQTMDPSNCIENEQTENTIDSKTESFSIAELFAKTESSSTTEPFATGRELKQKDKSKNENEKQCNHKNKQLQESDTGGEIVEEWNISSKIWVGIVLASSIGIAMILKQN